MTHGMLGVAVAKGFELDDSLGLDSLAVSLHQFWTFIDLPPGSATELRVLGPKRFVAYPTSLRSAIALARQADSFDAIGTFVIPNRISAAALSKYPPDQWHAPVLGCAGKEAIAHRSVLYIDCDAERPKESNATEREKLCAIQLANRIEPWLVRGLGEPACVGRGDSGNGLSLFVAIEPTPCSPETDEAIADLLRRMASTFCERGAKVDTSVHNRDRLVPLFGTMKKKGPHSPDRPHRRTYFSTRSPVARVPLSRLV